MKKLFLFIVAISFGLLSFSQDFAVLRLGSADASTLTPGDTVLVPVYCDDISDLYVDSFLFPFHYSENAISASGIGLQNINPKINPMFLNWNVPVPGEYRILYLVFGSEYLQMTPGELFFDAVFIYQGGETDLVWEDPTYGEGDVNIMTVDGCVCNQITFPAIFHVNSEEIPIEEATVIINGDIKYTNELGMTIFNLQNGEYSYSVLASGYDEISGTILISEDAEIIYVNLEAEETFPLMFNCEASCENDFNGWNLVINNEIIAPGETINLPAGDWDYSVAWLDCEPSNGVLTITEQMEFDCGLIINPEPHVTFHVFSNEGDVENVEVSVGTYTLMTDALGEAEFCLPGGDFDYVVSKEGYDTITGNFSYVDYCEDTLVDVLMDPLKIKDNSYDDFQIYPNPSKGIFCIESVYAKKESIEIYVMDLTGRTIFRKTYDNISKINIDLSDKKKGLYFLQLKTSSLILNSKLFFR